MRPALPRVSAHDAPRDRLACASPRWTRHDGSDAPGSRPCARYGHTLAAGPGGRLYLFGGTDGGNRANGGRNFEFGYEMNDLWRYNPSDRSWAELRPIEGSRPEPRYLHGSVGSVVVGNKVYVYGGLARQNRGDPEVHVFDLESGHWSEVPAGKVQRG